MRVWKVAAGPWLAGVLLAAQAAYADELPGRLTLDPAATEVSFDLGATLHTVRGTFRLREGEVRFDPESGSISGRVVIDATSGNTGNTRRDRNMHADVLESQRYPEIVLVPERIDVSIFRGDVLRGTLHAQVEIHGDRHAIAIPVEATRLGKGRGRVEGSFDLPFVEWGLPDSSMFLLSVDEVIFVRFVTEGILEGP